VLGERKPGGSVKLAVLRYAQGAGGCPTDLMERWLCKEYHCLPTELENQDVARLMRGLEAERIYATARKPFSQWTAAEQAVIIPVLELDNERQKRESEKRL